MCLYLNNLSAKRKTHTFLVVPFTYKTYDLKCNLLKEDVAFFVPRRWMRNLPQITRHRISVVCDLGKLIIYKNLKWWLQEVWTRGCVMSVHLFFRMFCIWVPCLQWEENSFCIAFTRVQPSPFFAGTIFSYKFRGYHSGVAKNQFLCLHHQIQSVQRLHELEDETSQFFKKKLALVYQSTLSNIPEGFKTLGTPHHQIIRSHTVGLHL